MPASEFDGWMSYLEWKNKESKKQQKKQGRGAKNNNKKVVQTNVY